MPTIDDSAYISENVIVAGEVRIGANASIWFGSVVRGDVAPITIGENTNVQDGTIKHTSRFDGPTNIGSNVTIGHRAVIHACTVHDYGFIGMGSIIMDKAVVESYGFVASGALIAPGKVVKSRELWAGVPAKFVRVLSDEEVAHIIDSAVHYIKLSKNYIRNT